MTEKTLAPSEQARQLAADLGCVLDLLNERDRPNLADKVGVDVAALSKVIAELPDHQSPFSRPRGSSG